MSRKASFLCAILTLTGMLADTPARAADSPEVCRMFEAVKASVVDWATAEGFRHLVAGGLGVAGIATAAAGGRYAELAVRAARIARKYDARDIYGSYMYEVAMRTEGKISPVVNKLLFKGAIETPYPLKAARFAKLAARLTGRSNLLNTIGTTTVVLAIVTDWVFAENAHAATLDELYSEHPEALLTTSSEEACRFLTRYPAVRNSFVDLLVNADVASQSFDPTEDADAGICKNVEGSGAPAEAPFTPVNGPQTVAE
ncbi:MAG: hypothetical protein HY075_09590 [Deltaproteobacteria bacterium]|nr:hypothetical protein [Deltaproteobacteria bacterium]